MHDRLSERRKAGTVLTASLLILFLTAGIAISQSARRRHAASGETPEAEFQMARVIYRTFGGAGSRGIIQPWWAVDYPLAEEHFFNALRRVTNLSVADDSRHLELTDDRIFQHPFLLMQQPGQGNWRPTTQEAARLKEYLLRGGFLLIDDFHGEYDWSVLQSALQRVLPDRKIVDIPEDDPIMHIFYDLQRGTPIPGERHLGIGAGGRIVAYTEPPRWRGIYDDDNRLMVAMNFNMDMGDAWEHADDPYYPGPMTVDAYRLGVNYVIYAMTH